MITASEALRRVLSNKLVPEQDDAQIISNSDDTQARVDAIIRGEKFRITLQRVG